MKFGNWKVVDKMPINYIVFFEVAVGIFTAFKARQKKQNPILWLLLGTAFSLIALAIILEMPHPQDQANYVKPNNIA
ncbi:hypothetical protein [Alkaliphilus crotonatoxidans]